MKNSFSYPDLLIALSIDPEVTHNILRLFLFLDSNIQAENEDTLGLDIPTNNCYVTTPDIIMQKLNMSPEEYNEAKMFLLNHHLLICQEVGSNQIWFSENANRWFLKSLGPNLVDVEKIKEPEILMDPSIYEKLTQGQGPKKL